MLQAMGAIPHSMLLSLGITMLVSKSRQYKHIEDHYIENTCKHLSGNDYELVFLACAIDTAETCYEDFIVPFTFFALLHNKKSCVEIVVQSPMAFLGKYGKALARVGKICGRHFLVRRFTHDVRKRRHMLGTYRFLEEPLIKGTYTYIMDIDVMLLEPVVGPYLKNWPDASLPYNNRIRPGGHSLTGVHFTKTATYFTPSFMLLVEDWDRRGSRIFSDEGLLFNLCREGHSLVQKTHKFRPIYGIHFSPNRSTGNSTTRVYRESFISVAQRFPQLFKGRVFRRLMKQLQNEFIVDE